MRASTKHFVGKSERNKSCGWSRNGCKEDNKLDLVKNVYLDKLKITPWSESASELYRPRDRRLSAK
jgi:hypothetical protein